MKFMAKSYPLLLMDIEDILKPPVYDILLGIAVVLGGFNALIIPVASSVQLASTATSVPLFIALVYIAIRCGAGVASLISNNIMQLYLSYPISRLKILLILLFTRILLPILIIIGLPLLAASVFLSKIVVSDIVGFLAVFGGRVLFTFFLGIVSLLFALSSKRVGVAVVLSIVFYFAYNIMSGIFSAFSAFLGEKTYMYIAQSLTFSDTLNAYLMGATEPPLWVFIPVPTATIVLTVLSIIYFTRRFEPT